MTPTHPAPARVEMTLQQLQERVRSLVLHPSTANVWVVVELSDFNPHSSGHCYLEMIQKDDQGRPVAKARGVIWSNALGRIMSKFYAATGTYPANSMKVMLCLSASHHPLYGFSYTITDIDPSYTLGDLLRLRKQILDRLTKEGVVGQNRSLSWPLVPQRVAIVSAPGAAGYGDFITQLFNNPQRLRFTARLFPATMQGATAAASVRQALEAVAAEQDDWDCVVIIRGGGSTSDLSGFEDYDLAATVAMFPIPVIVGIGHERDVTVLDYVANMRVKTPTAAAAWLISRGEEQLMRLGDLAYRIYNTPKDIFAAKRERLARCAAFLETQPQKITQREQQRLDRMAAGMARPLARLASDRARLDSILAALAQASRHTLARAAQHLDSRAALVDALSPQHTLRRGYSITRVDGRAVTDASSVAPGTVITTVLASGTLTSTTK